MKTMLSGQSHPWRCLCITGSFCDFIRKLYQTRGVFLIILFLVSFSSSYAQKLDLEKEYTISKKAKKGQLGDVSYDPATGNYKLIYVTKSSSTKAKFETYLFDKDFNFISNEEDELEASSASSKYTWWKWNGNEYVIQGITAEPNAGGKLILKKMEITYKFNWWNLQYQYKVKQLNKVKLRSEEGEKYYYINSFEDKINGDLYVITTVKGKGKSEDPKFNKEVTLLRINGNLDVVSRQVINSDNSLVLTYASGLRQNPASEGYDNLFFVFGRLTGDKDQAGANYNLYRTNNKLENLEKIDFFSPKTYWKISDVIWDDKKNEYLYVGGATNSNRNYYSAVACEMFPDAPVGYELESYMVMKTKDGKVVYNTDNPLQMFVSTLMKPPSQKKKTEYRGKKFEIHDHFIDQQGHLYIAGQNWATKYNIVIKEFRAVYQDVVGFHFDQQGKLVNAFCYDTKENGEPAKIVGVSQSFMEGGSPDRLYWTVMETENYKESENWILQYPVISCIDVKTGNLGDFLKLGKDGYFIDKSYPFLEIPDKDKVVFFGSNKSGKVIWFLRVQLD